MLAKYLSINNYDYAELNPEKLSYFIKHLSLRKTDLIDSYCLAVYAMSFSSSIKLSYFDSTEKLIKSYQSFINLVNKIDTQLKNFNHSQKYIYCESISKNTLDLIDFLDSIKKQSEKEIYSLICDLIPQTKEIIEKEKGIGIGLAIYLFPILYFSKNKTYKEIISYVGLSPRVFESGSSVKKSSKIDKRGFSLVRKSLFMSALSCVRFNPKFESFYNSMLERNKPKKVALIAVCNKIIRYLKNNYFRD